MQCFTVDPNKTLCRSGYRVRLLLPAKRMCFAHVRSNRTGVVFCICYRHFLSFNFLLLWYFDFFYFYPIIKASVSNVHTFIINHYFFSVIDS